MVERRGNEYIVILANGSITKRFRFNPNIKDDKNRARSKALKMNLQIKVDQWKNYK